MPSVCGSGGRVRPGLGWALVSVCLAWAGLVAPILQAQVPEYKLKAELVERFARFIEWPGETMAPASLPFVIGVFGTSPIEPYLEQLAGERRLKGRQITVRTLTETDALERVQILFIPSSEKARLEKILEKTAGKSVLTVGDSEGFADRGVLINFYVADENIRFEINDVAARKSGLKMSSKLLKLARLVHPEGES